jgi:hypothetical protein
LGEGFGGVHLMIFKVEDRIEEILKGVSIPFSD